jgi:hypothetical protein
MLPTYFFTHPTWLTHSMLCLALFFARVNPYPTFSRTLTPRRSVRFVRCGKLKVESDRMGNLSLYDVHTNDTVYAVDELQLQNDIEPDDYIVVSITSPSTFFSPRIASN